MGLLEQTSPLQTIGNLESHGEAWGKTEVEGLCYHCLLPDIAYCTPEAEGLPCPAVHS